MLRFQLINTLIRQHQYRNYLEIGTRAGRGLARVICAKKTGVDPRPNPQYTPDFVMTSDEFFAQCTETYDIIFIDGLHLREQLRKDVLNSLDHLAENGTIVCHDMLPESEEHQGRKPPPSCIWTGDIWKAFVELRMERSDLEMFVLEGDWGCGVIRRGHQELLVVDEPLTWDGFCRNKQKWLNLRTHL